MDGKQYTTVLDKTNSSVTRYTEFDEIKPVVQRNDVLFCAAAVSWKAAAIGALMSMLGYGTMPVTTAATAM